MNRRAAVRRHQRLSDGQRIEYVARVYVPTEAYWDVYYRFMLLIRQELKARNIVMLSDSTYIKNGDV